MTYTTIHTAREPAGVAAAQLADVGARASAAKRTQPRGPAVAGGAALALLTWSATYLARQGALGSAFPAPLGGDFALEGMALALAWLAAAVAGCLAVLSGAVVLRDPSKE